MLGWQSLVVILQTTWGIFNVLKGCRYNLMTQWTVESLIEVQNTEQSGAEPTLELSFQTFVCSGPRFVGL